MKYVNKKATPRDLLNAARALYSASELVDEARRQMDGKVKAGLLDNYIKRAASLRVASLNLENDFACVVAARYGVPVAEVPLFGRKENLQRADEYLIQLERRGV